MVELPEGRPQELSIDYLHFDLLNPRLSNKVRNEGESAVLEWMCRDGGVFDLMRSIGEQGYFNGEPLLVTPIRGSDTFTVVEGNRRLTALKLLQDPSIINYRKTTINAIVDAAMNKPSVVPCIVYSARDEILDYLGFRHVTGIKSWGPLAKARYLKDLSESDRYARVEGTEKYRQLARVIGSRLDYVQRILAGLKLFDAIESREFYNIEGLNETTVSFSLITTALGQPKIVEFLSLESPQDLEQLNRNDDSLEELTRWMFEKHEGRTKLGESRNFGDLNRVVASEIALQEFREGRTLKEALYYTDGPIETFRKFLTSAKQSIEASQSQLHLVRTGFQISDRKLLDDIRNIADIIDIVLADKLKDN